MNKQPPLNQDVFLKDLLQVQTFPVRFIIREQMLLFQLINQMLEEIQPGEAHQDLIVMQSVFLALHAKAVQSFNGNGIALPLTIQEQMTFFIWLRGCLN